MGSVVQQIVGLNASKRFCGAEETLQERRTLLLYEEVVLPVELLLWLSSAISFTFPWSISEKRNTLIERISCEKDVHMLLPFYMPLKFSNIQIKLILFLIIKALPSYPIILRKLFFDSFQDFYIFHILLLKLN